MNRQPGSRRELVEQITLLLKRFFRVSYRHVLRLPFWSTPEMAIAKAEASWDDKFVR